MKYILVHLLSGFLLAAGHATELGIRTRNTPKLVISCTLAESCQELSNATRLCFGYFGLLFYVSIKFFVLSRRIIWYDLGKRKQNLVVQHQLILILSFSFGPIQQNKLS